MLREETTNRYDEGLSNEAALWRQRISHAHALLPTLAGLSRNLSQR